MMMASASREDFAASSRSSNAFGRLIFHFIDRSTVYPKARWVVFVFSIVAFVSRIYFTEGFYVVTYGLGIYLLNLLIGFLSPSVDLDSEGGLVLPVRDAEEYRPFTRRLPEFKFWLNGMRAILVAFGMTFFTVFDLPVFWPILLVYFVLLFGLTMKQQIKHMIKHRYVPISWGKQTYGDITRAKQATPSSGVASGGVSPAGSTSTGSLKNTHRS